MLKLTSQSRSMRIQKFVCISPRSKFCRKNEKPASWMLLINARNILSLVKVLKAHRTKSDIERMNSDNKKKHILCTSMCAKSAE